MRSTVLAHGAVSRMLVALGLAVLGIGVLARAAWPGVTRTESRTPETRDHAVAGEWRIDSRRDDGRVQVILKQEWGSGASRNTWRSSFDIRPAELRGVTESQWSAADSPVSFELARDAGRFRCEGRLRRGEGSGRFVFMPNAEFRAGLERAGYRDVTTEELSRLALHDVSREWIRTFESRGLTPVTLEELIRLKVHDVSGAYLDDMRKAGLRDLSVDELVRLKVHGVEPSYVRELAPAKDVTVDEVIRLKVHGVTASYARDLEKLGYQRPSADELVRLKVHGVPIAFVRELRDVGYRSLSPDELVRLQIHGVTAASVRRATDRHGKRTIDELIRMKQMGEI